DDTAIVECSNGFTCPGGWKCSAAQNSCIDVRCGNGIIEADLDEMCDDGNNVGGDGCSENCLSDETCGNGYLDEDIDTPEECDGGGVDGMECNFDCTLAVCGDGYVNTAAGEECDSGGVDTMECNF